MLTSLPQLAHGSGCLYVLHRHHKSNMAGHRFVYVCSVLLLFSRLLLILYSSVTRSSNSTLSSIQTCCFLCSPIFVPFAIAGPSRRLSIQMCTMFFHGTTDTYWPGLPTWASTISAMSWGQRNIHRWSGWVFFFKRREKKKISF